MKKKPKEQTAGIHPQFNYSRFSPREIRILEKISKNWFLTRSMDIELATSKYNACLLKPTLKISEMFNISREVIAVFSPYPHFEPRTLDAFDSVERKLSKLRVESVCRVLISDDVEVEEKIENLLKSDPEQPIVIPFTFTEIEKNRDEHIFTKRFRKHFYSRDLFSFLSPLRKDIYFFGRSELIQEIVNRHHSGEHTGLFGLRKSGKTSIIYAIERHLSSNGEPFLSLDCESPSNHKLRWYELLEKLVIEYKRVRDSKYKLITENRYTEKTAADSFSTDILGIFRSKKASQVFLLFDEIERISPQTGSSSHWRDGEDFVYFWQTLRAFYQRNQSILTYMLVGTNPSCVELPIIAGHENPIFSSIPSQYVPAFTVEQTKQMVSRLGTFMGLEFDEVIFGKLADDYGGHPFLIRQICSLIHKNCTADRPFRVDKSTYEKAKKEFVQNAIEYLQMIIQVLRDWYPDEYEMLSFLAQGDVESFSQFANDHERYTKHLIGYGLIEKGTNGYTFKIESVKNYLGSINKHQRLNLSQSEKLAEISARRNALEKELKFLIKITIKTIHGPKKGAEKLLACIAEPRRQRLQGKSIEDFLNPDKSEIFLLDYIQIIQKEWESFKHIFDMEKTEFQTIFQHLNKHGRVDAHAKTIEEDEFTQLRLYFKRIESILNEWTT